MKFFKLWTLTTKWISCYLISPKPSTQLPITDLYLNWHIIAHNLIASYTSMDSHMAYYQKPKSYCGRRSKCIQEYNTELFWDPLCFCWYINDITHLVIFLLMIAYYIELLKHLKTINSCNMT